MDTLGKIYDSTFYTKIDPVYLENFMPQKYVLFARALNTPSLLLELYDQISRKEIFIICIYFRNYIFQKHYLPM